MMKTFSCVEEQLSADGMLCVCVCVWISNPLVQLFVGTKNADLSCLRSFESSGEETVPWIPNKPNPSPIYQSS